MAQWFEGGSDTFFFKGTNGRWRDVLTAEDLALYEKAVERLEPDLRQWLEGDWPRPTLSPAPLNSDTDALICRHPIIALRRVVLGRARKRLRVECRW